MKERRTGEREERRKREKDIYNASIKNYKRNKRGEKKK